MNGFGICEIPSVLQVIYFIKTLINIVKFIVPIGLILMVALDMGKGVINGDKKPSEIIKSSGNKFLAAIIIFLIPTIVDFSMGLVSDLTSYESCWANANATKIKEQQVLWDEEVKRREEEEKKRKEEERREEEEEAKREEDEDEAKREEENQNNIISDSSITFSYEYVIEDDYMPYGLFTPSTASSNKKIPLVVWLHGGGEFNMAGSRFGNTGLLKVLNEWKLDGFNAYVICPHVTGKWFSGFWVSDTVVNNLYDLLDHFISSNKINTNKVVLVGHSQGGRGVIYAPTKRLDFFSALVFLSAFDPTADISLLKDIPAKGYSEGFYYMQTTFVDTFGKENYRDLKTTHGDIPNMAFNLDENNDNKSDLVEWMLSQSK